MPSSVVTWLPDLLALPETLPRGPADFLRSLRAMLGHVAPLHLDPRRCRYEISDAGVDVTLAHDRYRSWDVTATVAREGAIVSAGGMHQRFDAPARRTGGSPAWALDAVRLIEDLLCGAVEIQLTYRGDTIARAEGFLVDDDELRRPLGYAGAMTPNRFIPFLPERTETVRISYVGER